MHMFFGSRPIWMPSNIILACDCHFHIGKVKTKIPTILVSYWVNDGFIRNWATPSNRLNFWIEFQFSTCHSMADCFFYASCDKILGITFETTIFTWKSWRQGMVEWTMDHISTREPSQVIFAYNCHFTDSFLFYAARRLQAYRGYIFPKGYVWRFQYTVEKVMQERANEYVTNNLIVHINLLRHKKRKREKKNSLIHKECQNFELLDSRGVLLKFLQLWKKTQFCIQ